jgi:S-adenosyl methyltransferase
MDLINPGKPHSARVYDYILGGDSWYQADKEAGDAMIAEWPALPVHMAENRAFMHRAARWLATTGEIRQFLDIGTGLPTPPNLHAVAQNEDPTAHVVYVDNDPLVLTHAEALMTSSSEGRTAYIDADMREVDAILSHRDLRETLDLDEPVALMLIGMLHFIHDDDAYDTVRRLMEPLPAGSYLAATIGTDTFAPEEVQRVNHEYTKREMPLQLRTHEQAEAFFDGMDLVDPGVVQCSSWHRRAGDPPVDPRDVAMYGGVARKR